MDPAVELFPSLDKGERVASEWMNMRRWALAALCAAILPGDGCAKVKADKPIKTTLCELMKRPEQFNGKLVQFRSDFVSKFQWAGFVDEGCSAKLQTGVKHPIDDLKPEQGEYAFTTVGDDNMHPERLNWKPIPLTRPVNLKPDEAYRAFQKYSDTKYRWPDGGLCLDCPLYRVNLMATGRFDQFETGTVAVRANQSTKAFH